MDRRRDPARGGGSRRGHQARRSNGAGGPGAARRPLRGLPDLAEAERTIIDAVSGEEGIEAEPEVQAFVEELGDNSINFAVRFWHKAEIIDQWRARDQAGQAIKRDLDEAGITMPFPQTTLWFGPDNTELKVRIEGDQAA